MKSTPRTHGYQQLLAAGLTIRQAYYWVARGYLHPLTRRPGSGHGHQFTADEIRVAALAARLVAVGFTMSAAFRVARGERDLGLGVRLVIDEESSAAVYRKLVEERFGPQAVDAHCGRSGGDA